MHLKTIRHWRLTQAAAILLSALFLSGCFNTQPSDNDIKSLATERFEREFSDLFTISDVQKINGYKKSEYEYVAELTMTATAQKSLNQYAEEMLNDNTVSSLDKFSRGMNITLLKLTMPTFETGDVIEFDRDYLYLKTENGWRIEKELLTENSHE